MSKRKRGGDSRRGRESPRRPSKGNRTIAERAREGVGCLWLRLKRDRAAAKSLLVFVACLIVLMFTYSRVTDSSTFEAFTRFTARATGFVLNVFGGGVQVDGTIVLSGGFSMGIIEACTGLIPMLILVSAVLAYPSGPKQKIVGISLGVLALFALNLIRTTTLFAVGAHFPAFFDGAHYLLWQSMMIIAAIALWLLWVSRVSHAVAK